MPLSSDQTPESAAADEAAPAGVGRVDMVGFSDDDAFNWGVFIFALLVALFLHGVLGAGANKAPQKKMTERIEMAVYKPPPPPPPPEPPPPPPPPEEKKPPPPPPPKELPPPPKEPPPPPPPSNDTPPPEPPSEPVPIVTGLNLNSVVQGNTGGPKVRVGNTTFGDPNSEKFVPPSEVKPYAGGTPGFKAAKASTITKEVSPSCPKPRFPKELADQGVEGTTELLLQVSQTGQLVSARVARSSGNKTLDQLSLDGVKKCTFKPGEVDGQPVDALFRYKFKWELYD